MPFPRPSLCQIASLFCLAFLTPSVGMTTPPEADKVAVDAVPGLKAFLQESYMGDPTVHIWQMDLDLPNDKVDEIILHIEDIDYCGSGGCEWSILRREPAGDLKTIATILAGDVTLKDDPVSGLRQPIAATRHGDKPMDIAGKTSSQVQRARERTGPYRSTKHVVGPCKGGYLWSGGAAGQGGVARYETCTRDEALLMLECQSDVGAVEARFAIDPGGFKESDKVPALFSVIRKQQTSFFPNPGTLSTGEMEGPMLSVLFDRYDGLLDALRQGNRAMLNASVSKLDLHLRGSSNAIDAMLSACPDGRNY
ncbi:hypothetical protein FDK21_17240 [Cohaesibacter sp. CAU 1516]|uniref:hypothetical protein n=1 Tax=Cohaesibacter sp. CAU 1516 TaxID=2576038 RepID=UPI0010FF42CF|nr:hypothetical protein [Cohaesibacter sp. CAU 1516]TLP43949.1 hypothetical protein FDK21_17240 [Cohaesibacter sp. CAU 1516]